MRPLSIEPLEDRLVPSVVLSGTVFEDVNYGGGAGRGLPLANAVGVPNARVELYSYSGSFLNATSTDAGGGYNFAASPGSYIVRVVNDSVSSTRAGVGYSLLPVQTFRTDATYGYAVPVTDHVGGEDPALADASDGSGTLGSLYTSTTIPESTTRVNAFTTSVSGLDFGFNFDTIVNTNDQGQGSLRQFVVNANGLANAGLAQAGRPAGIDNAVFMLADGTARPGTNPGDPNQLAAGVATISVLSPLPPVSDPIVLDGSTQPGYAGSPIIELRGNLAGPGMNGLTVTTDHCAIRGLVINGFDGDGILVYGAGATANLIQGNYIGTDAAGSAAVANGTGVQVIGAAGNTVGALTSAERNLISGNVHDAVDFVGTGAANNVIEGNFVGTNAAGSAAVPNAYGISVYGGAGTGNLVGGTAPGAGNLVSGNTFVGVYVGSQGTVVQGNRIGTDVSGTAAVPNSWGLMIDNAPDNLVGGSGAARNIISGNSAYGILVNNPGATGNVIQGNYVGTDVTGTANLGNGQDGVIIDRAADNLVGGSAAAARNVVSGNGDWGIALTNPGATGNSVQGNYVGVDVAGTSAVGNGLCGVWVDQPDNTVGGPAAGAGNVISGNSNAGLCLHTDTATGNVIQGNIIGTDAAGGKSLANGIGVVADAGAADNLIGGNLISGNDSTGITLAYGAAGNHVEGNAIGTGAARTAPLPNGNEGILIIGASGNQVGGTDPRQGNLIAFNVNGVVVLSGSANAILSNSITAGGGLGIDLGGDGMTPNTGTENTALPNDGMNSPVITAAAFDGSRLTVSGYVGSAPGQSTFAGARVELFLSHSGQALLGHLTTDAAGGFGGSWVVSGLAAGDEILATATDALGNTSEFSPAAAVQAALAPAGQPAAPAVAPFPEGLPALLANPSPAAVSASPSAGSVSPVMALPSAGAPAPGAAAPAPGGHSAKPVSDEGAAAPAPADPAPAVAAAPGQDRRAPAAEPAPPARADHPPAPPPALAGPIAPALLPALRPQQADVVAAVLGAAAQPFEEVAEAVPLAPVVTTSLLVASIGYVILDRCRLYWLASGVSAAPLWGQIDPLVILDEAGDEKAVRGLFG